LDFAAGPIFLTLLLVGFAVGVAGFAAYTDKASRINILYGMLYDIGLAFARRAANGIPLLGPSPIGVIAGIVWSYFFIIIGTAEPLTRSVLWLGIFTMFIAVLGMIVAVSLT